MSLSELNRSLGNKEIPPLLLLYGEERFQLETTFSRVLNLAVSEEDRDFNYHVFHGKDLQGHEVLDVARTLPVFSQRKLVLLKDAQHIPAAELDILRSYLKDPVPETVLVLVADKIDGRKKFFQEFKKKGLLVEFKKLYDNQIPSFVKNYAREAGYTFTEDSLPQFCKRVGSNLQEVHGELVKLFSYLGDRSLVDVADVKAIVSDTKVDSVFDLTNALGNKRVSEALRLLNRLLEEGVAPLLVLTMMVRHFRQLWKTRELLDAGTSRKELPRKIGVSPYFVDGLVAQSRCFSSAQYQLAFESFLNADLALKSSGAHPTVTLESLIREISAG